mmetsp:Transcript_64165/g.111954  ORF Transcript_64165/g.111954 Transcript_64165/m.111954 type:complete len:253 (+) Transcript_64165:48-806(+)
MIGLPLVLFLLPAVSADVCQTASQNACDTTPTESGGLGCGSNRWRQTCPVDDGQTCGQGMCVAGDAAQSKLCWNACNTDHTPEAYVAKIKEECTTAWMPDEYCGVDGVPYTEDQYNNMKTLWTNLQKLCPSTAACLKSGTPAPTPAPAATPAPVTSCPTYCASRGVTGGVVIGTAPFCGASCGVDCPKATCGIALKSWPDHGMKCGTGQKVCCCGDAGNALISKSSSMSCWHSILFIALWTWLRSNGQWSSS